MARQVNAAPQSLHLNAVDLEGVAVHLTGDSDFMTIMRRYFIHRILIDFKDLIISRHEHRIGTALNALFGAGDMPFGTVNVVTLGIGNIAGPFAGKSRHRSD